LPGTGTVCIEVQALVHTQFSAMTSATIVFN
jgi:hypothetical protein